MELQLAHRGAHLGLQCDEIAFADAVFVIRHQLVDDFQGVLSAIVAPVGGSIDDSIQPVTRRQASAESERLRELYLASAPAAC